MALPSGYTQYEYIESSGTQYIDTGFKPNQNTRTVIDFQATVAPLITEVEYTYNGAFRGTYEGRSGA